MDFRKKRWISLFAGLGIEMFAGILYVWSVFQAPLIEKYGWSIMEVSFAYSLSGLSCMVATILFGAKAHRLMSIRKELVVGILFYSLFLMATAFIGGRLFLLYLFFGVLSSAGIAFVYPPLISYAVELFPERSGFAGGLMTGGYGLGGILWALLAPVIYTATGDISKVFLILGGIYLVGMLLLSLFIFSPPPDFRHSMTVHLAEQQALRPQKALLPSVYDVDTRSMLRLPLFYLAFLMMLLMLSCGAMIINQGSPIMVHTFGTSPTAAAAIVSALAMANVAGRLLWGPLSDRLGKTATLVLINLLLILCLSGLLLLSSEVLFTAALLGVIICFGGTASLVAPLTAELFGNCHVGENYSVMFCVFGTSSLVGPSLISAIRDFTGGYTAAYLCAMGFALISLLISLILLRASKKAAAHA